MIGNGLDCGGLAGGGRITDAAAVSSCAGVRDQRSVISGQQPGAAKAKREGLSA